MLANYKQFVYPYCDQTLQLLQLPFTTNKCMLEILNDMCLCISFACFFNQKENICYTKDAKPRFVQVLPDHLKARAKPTKS